MGARNIMKNMVPVLILTICALMLSGCGGGDGVGESDDIVLPISRVSVDSSGNEGALSSEAPSISSDGRYVAFHSASANLVPNDTNGVGDIFVHDRKTGETIRASVDSSGNEANMHSTFPSISSDGRHVAFRSYATNLVIGDTNASYDVFVHDRHTGETTRVSVDSLGNEGDRHADHPLSISGDGRYVAFRSVATNLVAGGKNGGYNTYIHDRQTGQTIRVSVDSLGTAENSSSDSPSISGDGRYVAFSSGSTNLVVPNDTDQYSDIFVHDRQTAQTSRISVDSSGNEANMHSFSPSISSDGRYISFSSYATNIVVGDTTGFFDDIFVYDQQTGETTRVSVDSSGNEANGSSVSPSISGDGRYVAFNSVATNLVPNDTNGVGDIFVHDRKTGQTIRASVDSSGNEGNIQSKAPSISGNGCYVAFHSGSANFVPNDTNWTDIFVAPIQ